MSNTIWIVEDERSILEIMEVLLKDKGYNVRLFESPIHFLKAIYSQEKPDLICMDIHMNEGDGRDIAKELKTDPKTQHIPILLMTADVHIEEKAKEAQANGYIRKPFGMQAFLDKVSEMISIIPANHDVDRGTPSVNQS